LIAIGTLDGTEIDFFDNAGLVRKVAEDAPNGMYDFEAFLAVMAQVDLEQSPTQGCAICVKTASFSRIASVILAG